MFVKDYMTRHPVMISPDTRAAEAQQIMAEQDTAASSAASARIMGNHKIGCLPVIEDGVVTGILSEVDVMNGVQDMLGFAAEGVRVTIRMPDQRGEFAKVTSTLVKHGWGVTGIGSYPSPRRPGFHEVVLKIPGPTLEEVKTAFSQVPEQEVVDIRSVV